MSMSDIDLGIQTHVADMLPDPIAALDTKGTILWCNKATYEVSQLTSEEIIG